MSKRQEKLMSLVAAKGLTKSQDNNQELAKELLKDGMHGICFSLFVEGQKPGDPITETQIRRRLEILKPYTKWIRTFSCTEGNELIPPLAKEYGIKTLVGAWLSDDLATNDEEIESLVNLTQQGYVDIAAVGNEVLYRKELSEAELLDYINHVKQVIPGTPVGYVDAYYEFTERPAIAQACDVILANCYPYWEGCHVDYSFLYMKEMYQQAVKAAKGKKVIITETGWPSSGGAFEASEASMTNFLKYYANAQQWAKNEEIELFYFSSFDESWKTGDEGDVGAYWGIWDKNEALKF
ncbi:MAG: glycosyl hydrolase family 17 protein [Bacteroidia bacterium]|jgi:glucan 1,3-beta-glucosidase|nr:glycosyl hydrolase family 17 protein [Bacteroidia bacterium]